MSEAQEASEEAAGVGMAIRAPAGVDTVEAEATASPMRLLFIPLALVAAVLVVWLLVRWRGQESISAEDLVRDLGHPANSHWQQAHALAELLRGPQQAQLRQDAQLAAELATLLDAQLDAGPSDANRINLRVFLCRALGEFRVPSVQPVLIRASRLERAPAELAVRRSAVEALAAHADRTSAADRDPELLETLLAAAREHSDIEADKTPRAELRAGAAFALGVLGDPPALAQLQFLLGDPHPNVRYNAATGLARHGHAAALPVLIEMLRPDNPQATAGESSAAGRSWKQAVVLINALRAAERWAELNPPAAGRPLIAAVATLLEPERGPAQLAPAVQQQARRTLSALAALHSPVPDMAEEKHRASGNVGRE